MFFGTSREIFFEFFLQDFYFWILVGMGRYGIS